MQNIIAIEKEIINGAEVNSVNSREVYEYLEVKTRYNDWIRTAIERYDFEEGIDFLLTQNKVSGNNATQKDYIVTLDMAKELCMVSNTEKGKETRKYFIRIERELIKPKSFEEMVKETLLIADQRIKELEYKISSDKPLVDFATAISQSTACVKIGDWIKAINDSGDINIGRNKAFKWLRNEGYLQRDNMPYQQYIHQGLFEVKEGLVVTDIKQFSTFTTLLTAKGQMYFAKKLKRII